MHLVSGSSCTQVAGNVQVLLSPQHIPEVVPLCQTTLSHPKAEHIPLTAPEHEMPMQVLKPIIIGNTEEEKGDFQFDIVLCGKPIKAGLVSQKDMTLTLMDFLQLTSPPGSLSSSLLSTHCYARPALILLQSEFYLLLPQSVEDREFVRSCLHTESCTRSPKPS